MIIGKNRTAVIENIKTAAESADFYAKVELDDPVLSAEESKEIIKNYLIKRKKISYKIKSKIACAVADFFTLLLNKDTEIEGAEKLPKINGGAIITSNHFSPTENTVVRKCVKKCFKRKLAIVAQITNFAMKGFFGFLMNNANTVPLSADARYISREFTDIIEEHIKKNEMVLIYPEQEMWFNYRKPRPPKRGAYHFAAKLNVPVISCFVEMTDTEKSDTAAFYKVRHKIHILGVLYPSAELSVKENSQKLCEADQNLKKEAYERIYGKKLDYTFEKTDIAGWKNK